MALSLQDLLVGFDAGAPQAPRVNASAPRDRSSKTDDAFAALFPAKADSTPAPRPTHAKAPAGRSPAEVKDRGDRPAPASAADRPVHARRAAEKPTASDQTAAKSDNDTTASPAARGQADQRDVDQHEVDQRDDATIDAATSDTTATTDDQTAAVVTVAPAIVNAFQATLIASTTTDTAANDAITAATAPVAVAADATATPAQTATVAPAQVATDDDAGVSAAPSNTASFADIIAAAQAQTAATDANTTSDTPRVILAAAQTQQPAPATASSAEAPMTTQKADAPVAPNTNTAAPVAAATSSTTVAPAPQAPVAAEAAAQVARPTEPVARIAAPRAEPKAATRDTKTQADVQPASAKDNGPAPTITPAAIAIENSPALVAAVPAPASGGDAPTASADAPAAATPIAAPAANPQAHQIYQAAARTAPSLPPVTVEQVVAHVAKAADEGLDRFTIQLKPAHLGAIEIKLEMHDDGGIAKATISADRADTLDLLQRDSHRLERALENAGIRADSGSLSFNLRGDGGRQQPMFAQGSAAPYARPNLETDDGGANVALAAYMNARVALGGVDIRV
ncbi:MAG: flagellar hook-length control protein FliK [Gemmatimonas sp.]